MLAIGQKLSKESFSRYYLHHKDSQEIFFSYIVSKCSAKLRRKWQLGKAENYILKHILLQLLYEG